jgi:hypothetical protein
MGQKGAVFYVGKGIRARIEEHEREAQRGCDCEKCHVIRKIWESGESVQKRIVYETLTEQEALEYESHLINNVYGLENLTNRNGGATRVSRQKELMIYFSKQKELQAYKEATRPTLRDLRMEAGLTIPELAALAGLKYSLIGRMEDGREVSYVTVRKVLDVLNYQLQRKITREQLDKLNIKGQPH